MFVEVHEVGTDDWTTLPDAKGGHGHGHGRQLPDARRRLGLAPASVPRALPDGHGRRPARRPAPPASGTPRPATPNGWQDWKVDLAAYAGKKVEVSISVATDWATQGLGVWVDDAEGRRSTARVLAATSFETDTGRLDHRPAARGHRQPGERLGAQDRAVQRGRGRRHRRHRLPGFGFEGIDSARPSAPEFMRGVLEHLGASPPRIWVACRQRVAEMGSLTVPWPPPTSSSPITPRPGGTSSSPTSTSSCGSRSAPSCSRSSAPRGGVGGDDLRRLGVQADGRARLLGALLPRRSTAARAATTTATSCWPRRSCTPTAAASRWGSRSTPTWRRRRSSPSAPRSRSRPTSCPRSSGEKISCLGITEPDAGSDVSGIKAARSATATSG